MPDRYYIAHNKKGLIEQCSSCGSPVATRPIKKNEYVANAESEDVRLCAYCDMVNLPPGVITRQTVSPELASALNVLEQRIVQQLSDAIRNRGRVR